MTHRPRTRRRRGLVLAEAGIVYPLALMLILGTIVLGLGVFRYQEVAFQARQGARWASVQDPTPTAAQVLSQGITPYTLHANKLSATVAKVTINSVDYVSVTIRYQWAPEAFPGFISPVTLKSTSKQPVSP